MSYIFLRFGFLVTIGVNSYAVIPLYNKRKIVKKEEYLLLTFR